ncbi:MAG TPA: alginate lyase family protein [Bauldia sp.]|nr:alginate lyase family protein [Bauldia sp.]
MVLGLVAWPAAGHAAAAVKAPPAISTDEVLRHFIPQDVLDIVHGLKPADRERACQTNFDSRTTFVTLKPQKKMQGMSSQMKDTAALGEALDQFAGGASMMGAAVVVRDDDAQKAILFDMMTRWAKAGAYLGTIDCSKVTCPQQWTSKRGYEKAPVKDAELVRDRIATVAHTYFSVVKDYAPERAEDHRLVETWLHLIGQRNDRDMFTADPAVGVQHHNVYNFEIWDNLIYDLVDHGDAFFQKRLSAIYARMDKETLADGSFDQKTARGSTALEYQFSALDRAFGYMEVARANGVDLYPHYRDRLDKAAAIFLDTLDDIYAGHNDAKHPAAIYKWAKADWRGAGDPTVQNFLDLGNFHDQIAGSSWLYIYAYRFPDSPLTARIHKLLSGPEFRTLHATDSFFGVNIGCLYRLGDAAFLKQELSQPLIDEASLKAMDEAMNIVSAPVTTKPMSIEKIAAFLGGGDRESDVFYVVLNGVSYDSKPIGSLNFNIIANYDQGSPKNLKTLNALRISQPLAMLGDPASRVAKYQGCGDMAFDGRTIRLHYGVDANLNDCVITLMAPSDREFWTSVFQDLPGWIKQAAAKGGGDAPIVMPGVKDAIPLLEPMFEKKLAEASR